MGKLFDGVIVTFGISRIVNFLLCYIFNYKCKNIVNPTIWKSFIYDINYINLFNLFLFSTDVYVRSWLYLESHVVYKID